MSAPELNLTLRSIYDIRVPRGAVYTSVSYLGCRNGRYYFAMGGGVTLVLEAWAAEHSEIVLRQEWTERAAEVSA